MTNDDTGDNAGVGRRRFLKYAGVSLTPYATTQLAAGQTARSDRAGSSGGVAVPIRANQDGVVERKQVPRAWAQQRERVRELQERIQRRNAGRENVGSVERVRGEQAVGGKRGFALRVERSGPASPLEDVTVPESVPVRETSEPESGPAACGGFTTDINPAVGGIKCSADGFGTICVPVSDTQVQSEDMVLTVSHLFSSGGACDEDIEDDNLYQADSDFYGAVYKYDGNADMAVVDGSDASWADEEAVAEVKDENSTFPADDYHTSWGIDDLIASQEWICQMGTTTGQTWGPVTGNGSSNGWNSCVDFEGEGVTVDITNAEGDSGGPVYKYVEDNKVSIISMHQMWIGQTGTRTCGGYSTLVESGTGRGVAFHQLANNHNLSLNT